jgi:hypothetical protein
VSPNSALCAPKKGTNPSIVCLEKKREAPDEDLVDASDAGLKAVSVAEASKNIATTDAFRVGLSADATDR